MITVILLVATLALPDGPPTRVVAADWPFFRTLIECQNAARSMQKIPQIVDTIKCEYHQLDTSTGRIVK